MDKRKSACSQAGCDALITRLFQWFRYAIKLRTGNQRDLEHAMTTKTTLILLASAVISLAGIARSASAYVSDGMEYEISCSADGYVLTSKYPVTRMIGTGADTQAVPGIERIYFGRSCDAFHKIFGKGKWCWANGGFVAEFPDHRFGFGRQELSCHGAEAYQGNCGCE
jgi:hypothetical protein